MHARMVCDKMSDVPNFTKPWPLAGDQVSVRFRPELLQRIDSMAKRAGVTRTLVINRLLEWALASVPENDGANSGGSHG